MKALRLLNTPGGHIVVLLFLIMLGLVAVKLQVARGEDILIGALAALLAELSSQNHRPSTTPPNQKDQRNR
jgi:hypothetical protein